MRTEKITCDGCGKEFKEGEFIQTIISDYIPYKGNIVPAVYHSPQVTKHFCRKCEK